MHLTRHSPDDHEPIPLASIHPERITWLRLVEPSQPRPAELHEHRLAGVLMVVLMLCLSAVIALGAVWLRNPWGGW